MIRRLILLAILAAPPLWLAGCGDVPTPRPGTAQAEAAGAAARADAAGATADQAALDAAQAEGRAAALTQAALEQPTAERIRAAADARVNAACARAVADATADQDARLRVVAQLAQQGAAAEREREAASQAYLAWVRLCRILGLSGVVAGAILGSAVGYLARSPRVGVAIGATLAGTGLVVLALGPATAWLPWILAPAGVLAVAAWAWAHRLELGRTTTARAAVVSACRVVDAVERDVRTKVVEAKVELAHALTTAGMAEDIESLRGPARDWSVPSCAF